MIKYLFSPSFLLMTGFNSIVTALASAEVIPIVHEHASPYIVSGKSCPMTGIAEKLTPSRSKIQVACTAMPRPMFLPKPRR